MDLSVEEAARNLDIAPGSLRNIESGQPRAVVSLRLAHRAARFYKLPVEELVDTKTEAPEPSPKRERKGEPLAPPKRETKDNKAPKRMHDAAVAS